MRVYFDSSIMVYHVENISPQAQQILNYIATQRAQVVISDLVRMECLVGPLKNGDTALVADFGRAFALAEVVPLTSYVFDEAARIRASGRFKTPDAIHLAAATVHQCDRLFTQDIKLAAFNGIPVDLL